MPISLSAKKSLRKSNRNNKVNVSFKIRMKKILKDFVAKPTKDGLDKVYSIVDKAVKNKIYTKNKATRVKASYSKKIEKIVKKPVKKAAVKTSKKMS